MSILRLSLYLIALVFPALAQTESNKDVSTVRFTVWGAWAGKEMHLKSPKTAEGEDRHVKIDLLDLGYTPELPFRRSQPLVLSTRLERDGEVIYQPVLSINVPADVRQPLVMIFPASDGTPKFRIFDLHPSAFPYGGYQVVNMCGKPLLARMDKTSVKIPAGASRQFKGTGEKQQNVWLRVGMENDSKEVKIVYSSMMRNRDDKRMFMFFHPSENPSTPVAVRTLVDFTPVAKTP